MAASYEKLVKPEENQKSTYLEAAIFDSCVIFKYQQSSTNTRMSELTTQVTINSNSTRFCFFHNYIFQYHRSLVLLLAITATTIQFANILGIKILDVDGATTVVLEYFV